MKNRFFVRNHATPLLAILAIGTTALALTPKEFFQNTALEIPSNYNPAGLPNDQSDVLLTTSATALTLSGSNLAMTSLNQTNNNAYTLSNNTTGTTNSVLTLGVFGGIASNSLGGDPKDLIYVGGATSTLTIQGANSGTGTGVLRLNLQGAPSPPIGNFNVAQAGASLNISAAITGTNVMITKTGAGTLNLSGPNSYNGLTSINAGVVNVLPGSNLGVQGIPSSSLAVNNNNTGPGTDVTLNLQTSIVTGRLNGTLATPASGTNRAIVNLAGPGVELNLTATGSAIPGDFAGTITGAGSVTSTRLSHFQSFSGNNTYTGTTSISGVLLINGITTGQGDYIVGFSSGVQPGTLGGTGTIGLAPNAQIMVGGTLEPGPYRDLQTPGTLHVQASGTGGVVFNGSFWVDVAGGGVSDLLAIAGGSIDLRGTNDRLTLTSLPGAFDGSSYTIATFDQNLGGGTFNTVSGLPANYRLVYEPTSIRLLAVPEPSALTAGLLGISLLLGTRRLRPHWRD